MKPPFDFWHWLFVSGPQKGSGVRKLLNIWSAVFLLAGILAAALIEKTLEDASRAVLLPLAGVLVGLSFAWSGNAQALLQTPEVELLASEHPGGLPDFVHTFQLAVLLILLTLVAWALAGLGVYEAYLGESPGPYFFCKTLLYFLVGLTLRECWQVILGTNQLLLRRAQLGRRN